MELWRVMQIYSQHISKQQFASAHIDTCKTNRGQLTRPFALAHSMSESSCALTVCLLHLELMESSRLGVYSNAARESISQAPLVVIVIM
jgi:hypothetical protein